MFFFGETVLSCFSLFQPVSMCAMLLHCVPWCFGWSNCRKLLLVEFDLFVFGCLTLFSVTSFRFDLVPFALGVFSLFSVALGGFTSFQVIFGSCHT